MEILGRETGMFFDNNNQHIVRALVYNLNTTGRGSRGAEYACIMHCVTPSVAWLWAGGCDEGMCGAKKTQTQQLVLKVLRVRKCESRHHSPPNGSSRCFRECTWRMLNI